jgi:hypothetical protein
MSGHPSWCTGGFIVSTSRLQASASRDRRHEGLVFSSVLKESESSDDFVDAAASSPAPAAGAPQASGRTLRTAEQARASHTGAPPPCTPEEPSAVRSLRTVDLFGVSNPGSGRAIRRGGASLPGVHGGEASV